MIELKKIEGLEELTAALREMPQEMIRKVLGKSVASGGSILRTAFKKAAPVRKEMGRTVSYFRGMKMSKSNPGQMRYPGFLKANVKNLFRRKKSTNQEVHYMIGPFGDAFYGYIVERGHGGPRPAPAHSWMIPTWDQNTQLIIDRMTGRLKEGYLKVGSEMGFKTREL